MKLKILLSVMLTALLVPGLALATNFTLDGTADCDGWSATATVYFGHADREAVMNYTVTLTNLDTGEVEEQTGSEDLGFMTYTSVTYDFSGTWSDLCGNYEVMGMFVMTGIDLHHEASFMSTFTCHCDEPEGCFRTPGYWKTHPDDPAWPASGFAIGGVHYSNSELIAIMERPVKGDATVILAHHLIAAKLNALAGEDGADFADAISHGDAMLTMYPLGSKPSGGAKDDVLDAKNVLVGYNEIGCGDDDMDMDMFSVEKALPDEDTSSWGDLKSQYR